MITLRGCLDPRRAPALERPAASPVDLASMPAYIQEFDAALLVTRR